MKKISRVTPKVATLGSSCHSTEGVELGKYKRLRSCRELEFMSVSGEQGYLGLVSLDLEEVNSTSEEEKLLSWCWCWKKPK